jgi:hypothetical protein
MSRPFVHEDLLMSDDLALSFAYGWQWLLTEAQRYAKGQRAHSTGVSVNVTGVYAVAPLAVRSHP